MKTRPSRSNVEAHIPGELFAAFGRLDADAELLAIVGRWRDTPVDHGVLSMRRDDSAGRPALHRAQ